MLSGYTPSSINYDKGSTQGCIQLLTGTFTRLGAIIDDANVAVDRRQDTAGPMAVSSIVFEETKLRWEKSIRRRLTALSSSSLSSCGSRSAYKE